MYTVEPIFRSCFLNERRESAAGVGRRGIERNRVVSDGSRRFLARPRRVWVMIRRLRLPAVALACAMAGAAAAADIKVGFVDVSRVLDQSPQAREARERIQAEFAPIDQEILRLQRELRALEEQLLRDGDVMANADRMRLERDVLSRKRELRRSQEEFREDLNLRRNQELQKLQRQVVLAIRAMAKSEDYDLVISDGVLFASTRIDLTGTVLERLVEEHERQGGN